MSTKVGSTVYFVLKNRSNSQNVFLIAIQIVQKIPALIVSKIGNLARTPLQTSENFTVNSTTFFWKVWRKCRRDLRHKLNFLLTLLNLTELAYMHEEFIFHVLFPEHSGFKSKSLFIRHEMVTFLPEIIKNTFRKKVSRESFSVAGLNSQLKCPQMLTQLFILFSKCNRLGETIAFTKANR